MPSRRSSEGFRWRLPFVVGFATLIVYTIFVTSIPLVYQLTRNYPTNPWESGITLEAVRLTQGLPVYEDFETSRATQMYGWMNTVLLGTLFHWLPVSNSTGRWVSLIASLLLVGGLTAALSRGRGFLFAALSFAALFSVSAICDNYFAAGRLDMLSILFGAAGVWVSFLASQRRDWRLWVGACFWFLVGVSFKQTAAAFTLIPLAAIAWDGSDRKKHLLMSVTPLASVVLYFLGMWLFAPLVFEYMVVGFTHYPVPPIQLLQSVWAQIRLSPLLLFLLYLFFAEHKKRLDAPLRWYLAAALVLLLPSCIAYSKAGGSPNSLMPYYLAMTAATLALLQRLGFLQAPPASVRQLAISGFVLLLWGAQAFPDGLRLNRYYFLPDARQADYLATIDYVRGLAGTVFAPEDPTLVFRAKAELGRNIYLERDVRGLASELPPSLEEYLSKPQYVVDVINWMGDEYISPALLTKRGYVLDRQLGSYAVWRKSGNNVAN